MGHRIDDIVGILSGEGQSSAEEGRPEDRGMVPDGFCWRCVERAVDAGHDLCPSCRAFLLGDTDFDPVGTAAVGDAPVRDGQEVLLGQSSYIADLFDQTNTDLVANRTIEIAVELHGGLADGVHALVASSGDGAPPAELFIPDGMDHGAMHAERYVLDRSSGPARWRYDAVAQMPLAAE